MTLHRLFVFLQIQPRRRGWSGSFGLSILTVVALLTVLFAMPSLASDVAGVLLPEPKLDFRPRLVDSDGNRFLITARCGANVFVRVADRWQLEQRLGFECLPFNFGGSRGAIDDDALAIEVGDGEGGKHYQVFERLEGTWHPSSIVTGSWPALQGDVLAMGVRLETEENVVRIYRRSEGVWSATQDIMPPDAQAGQFGPYLDLEGGLLVVGAPEYEAPLGQIGSLYVFEDIGGQFVFRQRLFAAVEGELGEVVAIDGTRIVGYDDTLELFRIFDLVDGAWTETGVLVEESLSYPTIITLEGDVLVGFEDRAIKYAFISRFDGTQWSVSAPIADERAWLVAPGEIVTEPSTANQGWRVLVPDGAGWQAQQTLGSVATSAFGEWGGAVAADGDLLATGIPAWEASMGAVQLYRRDSGSWRLEETLKPWGLDDSEGAQVGAAVDVDQDRVIVGAFTWAGSRGQVWLFERTNDLWSGTELDGDPSLFDYYGEAVAISGDWAAAGLRNENQVRLWQKLAEGWVDQGTITSSDAAPDDFFGGALAMDGDTLAVGARRDQDNGSNSGSVYLFERSGDTWSEVGKLTPDDAAPDDFFGVSLDLEGDRLVVGANQPEPTMTAPGAAYVFERTGEVWSQVQKLTASDGAGSDSFGRVVSLVGEQLVVGAPDVAGDTGRVYVFEHDGTAFKETLKLNAPDGVAGDKFGLAVAALGDGVAVGAPERSVEQVGDGGAYLFDFSIFADGFESGDLSAWSAGGP